jgi:hypothetical protein
VLEDTSSVTDTDRPYLSVVLTSRNDDHGGDPTKRLNAFVQSFDAQCRLFGLNAEVIIVEWNPPVDKPRLSGRLQWPVPSACTYRFIEVPSSLHERFQFADVLPLFQMIAKNVGIRRARGEFILATNIDIVFSNELVEWLAFRRLDRECLYRADRHDVGPDIPIDASLQAQMDYCATHQLRVHRKWGTESVDGCGEPLPVANDIVDGRTIRLGRGWHVLEGAETSPYRWAMERAFVHIDASALPAGEIALEAEVEPHPGTSGARVDLAVGGSQGVLEGYRITRRQVLRQPLDRNCLDEPFEFRVMDATDDRKHLPAFERRGSMFYVMRSIRVVAVAETQALSPFPLPDEGWFAVIETGTTLGVDARARHLSVITGEHRWAYCLEYGPMKAPEGGEYRFTLDLAVLEGGVSAGVLSARREWLPVSVTKVLTPHGYVLTVVVQLEQEASFSIMLSNEPTEPSRTSRFVVKQLSASVHASRIVAFPGASRSATDSLEFPLGGWRVAHPPDVTLANHPDGRLVVTSHGEKGLYSLEYGPLRAPTTGMYSFVIEYQRVRGHVVGGLLSGDRVFWLPATLRHGVSQQYQALTLSGRLKAGQMYWLMLWNDHEDPRTGSQFTIRSVTASVEQTQLAGARVRLVRFFALKCRHAIEAIRSRVASWLRAWKAHFVGFDRHAPEYLAVQDTLADLKQQHEAALARVSRLSEMAELQTMLQDNRPDNLHLNGCGDFQLMSRDRWHELRGYAEFETFSMNIDSLLSSAAHYAGLREVVLAGRRIIYHMEHEKGSGWTPEGEAILRRRIAERGITWLDARDVFVCSAYMHWLRRPLIVNGSDWGLGAFELAESTMSRAVELA